MGARGEEVGQARGIGSCLSPCFDPGTAAYKRGDPATKHKQGVLSYDGSATLDEIRQGRGLANTILMIQVPHDGPTGVSPWIAGALNFRLASGW